MRLGAYDPTVQMCSNCLVWKRSTHPRGAKFPGLCRGERPKVTHLRSVLPRQGPGNQVQMEVVDAELSGWPTTMEDDSCYQHVAMLSQ